MTKIIFQKLFLRVWLWVGIFTLILWVYPVAYRTTRFLMIVGILLFWSGAIWLWRRKKMVVALLALAAFLLASLICLPGRPVQTETLASDYCEGLRFFRGVRYIWGGEGMLGIDCSGLVRQGLIWGQVRYGLRTLNGRPIRNALWLWWNDCSALALRDGFKNMTHECFRANSIIEADSGRLQIGDLATLDDGVHVMAYLGDHTWIEADAVGVIEVTLPTENPWFRVPVVFVRWRCLE